MAHYRFSRGRRFEGRTGEVVADGRVVRLEPQPAALLALLADRAGTLVTHEELRRHLWADGRHVDYAASLHYAVRQVRKALDDGDLSAPADIEAMPRRGYRLRREALACPAGDGSPLALSGWIPPALRSRGAAACLVAAIVTGVVAFVERQPNPTHHETAVAVARAVHDLIFGT
jgi:DNA-binding winged helix-turn-helix (wHTH) protein